jgi:uncharacterized protein YndB with AHSA1/START domain
VITVAMSTAVGADPGRVWRALSAPDELIRWDEQLEALLDPAEGYPQTGQQIRWRCRLGNIVVVLRKSLLEVVPSERLRSITQMGLFRFDETFTLGCEAGDPHRTRLQLKLVADNSIPVVGGLLDRFAVRRLATGLIDSKLRAIQKWCESHP